MNKVCVTVPEKGSELFLKLRKAYGREMAQKLYLKAIHPKFQRDFRNSLEFDGEHMPTYESFMENSYIKKYIGTEKIRKAEERTFRTMDDTMDNYITLLSDAKTYSEKSKDFVAVVQREEEKLSVTLLDKNGESAKVYYNQQSTMMLNRLLENMFKPIGITVGKLSQVEQSAGRTGVTDFDRVKGIAKDFSKVIRVANNSEGVGSVSEEFSHLILGTMTEDPLVQRCMEMLRSDPVALKRILGNQYEDTLQYQNEDYERLAFEALGKLLKDNLLKQTEKIITPIRNNNILRRLVSKILSMFQRFNADEVDKMIIDADEAMSEIAKRIMKNGIDISAESIENIDLTGQFNDLSQMVNRNIEILKQVEDAEIKRYRVTGSVTEDQARSTIKMVDAYAKEDTDTVMGMCLYAKNAELEMRNLKERFEGLMVLEKPEDRYKLLIDARNFSKSYGAFIESMNKALVEEKDAEFKGELTTGLFKERQIGDETVYIEEVIQSLNTLNQEITSSFSYYGKKLFLDFIAPYMGHDGKIIVPFGRNKGKMMDVKDLLDEANGDISMFDMWLDPMGTSSDILLQLFDAAYKDAADKARMNTISHVRMVQDLMRRFEKAGITDFEWMFERTDDGRKTGNYISKINQSQFEKDKREFEAYLTAKYGKNPSGDAAQNKIAERKQWRSEHATLMDGSWVARDDVYENKDYAALPEMTKALLEEFLALKEMADAKLPTGKTYNTKAIQIRKSGTQRLFDSAKDASTIFNNIKGQVNEALFDQVDDDQMFGVKTGLQGFDGKEYMIVPTMYLSELENPDELSTDVFSTLMSYFFMADKYREIANIVNPLEVGRAIVTEGRKINQVRGNLPVVEKFRDLGKDITNPIYSVGNSNIQKKLDEFFECQIYGRHLKDAGAFKIGDKQVNKNKLVNQILKYSSLAQLGLNWMANMANVTTGIAMQNIEAAAHEHFTPSQLASADAEYAKMMIEYVPEIGSRVKNSKLALFDTLFDIKQDYRGRLAGTKKNSVLERVFGSNVAFFGQDAGDHWLYNRTAIAMCKHMEVKVPDGKGGYKNTNLWDALQIRNAVEGEDIKEMYLPEGTLDKNGNPVSIKKVARQILHVNQHLFGVYNDDDMAVANRVIIGRLLLQYKKWIKPQMNKRFMAAQYNVTMEAYEEGYYRTFARVANELIRGTYQIGALKDQLTEHEKANLTRAVVELIQCFAVYALANLVNWKDDKNRPWAQKFAEYTAQRLAHELGALAPTPWVPGVSGMPFINENLKTLKTPMASISAIQNLANLAGSLSHPEDWNDELQSGAFQGHSTLYKNFMKAPIPGVAQYKTFERFKDDLDTSIAYYIRAY